jgi:hypothetical protein
MKLVLLSVITILTIGIGFSACGSETKTHARSIYMLLDTSKKTLSAANTLSEAFTHVINDLSPGDSLAINAEDELLAVEFSKDASKAYAQKRDFRRKVIAYIKDIKPKLKDKFLPSIAIAKAFLDKKIAMKKSIIYFNTPHNISLHTDNLEGYTISMFDLKDTPKDFSRLKTKVETANGSFVVASNIDDLNQVLSYK